MHDQAGFQSGRLGGIVGGVAFDALGGFGDFQLYGGGKVDTHGRAFDEENFYFLAFLEEVFGISHKFIGKSDVVVGLHVHEVVNAGFGVGELELLAVGFDDVDLFAGGETDGLGLSGVEGADGSCDEGVSFTRSAVFESEDDTTVTFVFDALPAFEVGCDDCHK